jgi:hypothetical protein
MTSEDECSDAPSGVSAQCGFGGMVVPQFRVLGRVHWGVTTFKAVRRDAHILVITIYCMVEV